MTENEAKTKWCPMVRAGNEAGCNRSNGTVHCIASDCMMWRFQFPEKDQPLHGYCGLAGKPWGN